MNRLADWLIRRRWTRGVIQIKVKPSDGHFLVSYRHGVLKHGRIDWFEYSGTVTMDQVDTFNITWAPGLAGISKGIS